MQAGGQGFDSPHLHHRVAASVISLAATFLQKSPCAHFAASPYSQKGSLRYHLFYECAPAAHIFRVFSIENTAALVRLPLLFPKKPIGFSGALFLFCKVRFASTFFFSKNVYACSLASPFPKKSYDFLGALCGLPRLFYKSPRALILLRLLFREKS